MVVFFSRGLRLLIGEGPPDTKDLDNQMTRLPFAKRLSSTLALGYTDAQQLPLASAGRPGDHRSPKIEREDGQLRTDNCS